MSSTGTDGSYLSEAIRAKILSGLGIIPTLLYENGLPLTGASPYKSFTVLTESALRDSIHFNAHGLVQLMGHGHVYGVYPMFWASDANSDRAVNTPAQPIGSQLKSGYETAIAPLATLLSGIGARKG